MRLVKKQQFKPIGNKYHIYKFAGDALRIAETDFAVKQKILSTKLPKKFNGGEIFKELRNSKNLLETNHNQEVLDAIQNIKRLCDNAFAICDAVAHNKLNIPVPEDEIVEFLEVTNEMHPCVKKELYDRVIKKLR
jgi:hypothetical protein